MANVELSVIIPSKNNKAGIAELIRRISETMKGTDTEFIIIDMNSSDNSVIAALNEIKNNNLRGYVIQSGGGNISSALNTGIYKAEGKYITFVFMSRLYKDYITGYLRAAEENSADFVFAVPSSDSDSTRIISERLKNSKSDRLRGTDVVSELIRSRIFFDFSAVMLRRDFLLDNHIRFYEDCNYGYAEAFIYNVLLCQPRIEYTDIRLERDHTIISSKEETASNASCYGRIEAMLKVYENCQLLHMENKSLSELFEYRKLPSVVMSVVDILKRENFSYSAIKRSLRQKGYDRLLRTSHVTPKSLKKRIFVWKNFPWYYRV